MVRTVTREGTSSNQSPGSCSPEQVTDSGAGRPTSRWDGNPARRMWRQEEGLILSMETRHDPGQESARGKATLPAWLLPGAQDTLWTEKRDTGAHCPQPGLGRGSAGSGPGPIVPSGAAPGCHLPTTWLTPHHRMEGPPRNLPLGTEGVWLPPPCPWSPGSLEADPTRRGQEKRLDLARPITTGTTS